MNYIFVHCTLRKGCKDNVLLKDAEFVCSTETVSKYALCLMDGKPIVIKQEQSTIKGDVYKVSDATLSMIDKIKGHNRVTNRERVAVCMPDGTQIQAWLYFYTQPMKNSVVIPSGDYLQSS